MEDACRCCLCQTSATAEEFASTFISPGRCHLLLGCPVPPLQQTKEDQLSQPLHTAHVLQAPNPIPTDFLWTFSSFSVLLSQWDPSMASTITPTPFCPGHSSASRVTACPSAPPLFCPQCTPCPLCLMKLQEVSFGQVPRCVKVPLDSKSKWSTLQVLRTVPQTR